jgi:hypothetical protein
MQVGRMPSDEKLEAALFSAKEFLQKLFIAGRTRRRRRTPRNSQNRD